MNAILLTAFSGVFFMLSSLFIKNKRFYTFASIILLLITMYFNYQEIQENFIISYQTDFINVTKYSLIFNEVIFGLSIIYFSINGSEITKVGRHHGEAVALIFFALCGSSLLTSYNNLLILFLGFEILTIPLYILTGIDNHKIVGIEASIKYFIMGTFTTGILLLGICFIYGGTGTFLLHAPSEFKNIYNGDYSFLTAAGLILVFTAFCFKVSAAPFHFWTPDVYDGAPTVFTSFMASIVKISGLFAFIKLFDLVKIQLFNSFYLLLFFIILASFIIGNITAIFQQSVKRMLAYSSIAQAGFMLLVLFTKGDNLKEGLMLYAVAYSIASIGIFAVLVKFKDLSYEGFNGFAHQQPLIAFCLSAFLLSLAGIPLTAGFMAKFYVLKSIIHIQSIWGIAIIAVIFSAISLVYYIRLIQAMYFKEINQEIPIFNKNLKIQLILLVLLNILIGCMPTAILGYIYF